MLSGYDPTNLTERKVWQGARYSGQVLVLRRRKLLLLLRPVHHEAFEAVALAGHSIDHLVCWARRSTGSGQRSGDALGQAVAGRRSRREEGGQYEATGSAEAAHSIAGSVGARGWPRDRGLLVAAAADGHAAAGVLLTRPLRRRRMTPNSFWK